jgi:hypothetical protein
VAASVSICKQIPNTAANATTNAPAPRSVARASASALAQ